MFRSVVVDVDAGSLTGARDVAQQPQFERVRHLGQPLFHREIRAGHDFEAVRDLDELLASDEIEREALPSAARALRCHQHVDLRVLAVARVVHVRDLAPVEIEVAHAAAALAVEENAKRAVAVGGGRLLLGFEGDGGQASRGEEAGRDRNRARPGRGGGR